MKCGLQMCAQVIEGLDWVREHYVAPAVVVMALGGEPQYALDMAVRALVLSGVSVVVAAGNEDSDACAKSPARYHQLQSHLNCCILGLLNSVRAQASTKIPCQVTLHPETTV